MTKNENRMIIILVIVLLSALSFLNISNSISKIHDLEIIVSEYETNLPLFKKTYRKLESRRILINNQDSLEIDQIETDTGKYELGLTVKSIMEKSGGKISSFSIAENEKESQMKSVVIANPNFIPEFLSKIYKSSIKLSVTSFSISSRPDGMLVIQMRLIHEK